MHVIQGEAGSDPKAQLAVATVMQNRLNDGSFGGDIQSVVQPEPV
jgi:spore germination cell wall hydrolase CwlJ-like protein